MKKTKKSLINSQTILLVLVTTVLGAFLSYLSFDRMLYYQINTGLYFVFSIYFSSVQNAIKRSQKRRQSMLNFIDQFIITLSIHKTLRVTLKSVEEVCDEEIRQELVSFQDGEPQEKLEYLSHYFSSYIYEAFLDIINTYLEAGGNILQASSILLKEVAEERTRLMKTKQIHLQKFAELIVAWVFVFFIIALMRYIVSDIYLTLLDNPIFINGLIGFNVFILSSFVVYYTIVLQNEVRKKTPKHTSKYLPVEDFVRTFTLFRMSMYPSSNVYKTLEKTASLSQGPMSIHLLNLVGELKVTTSIAPFLTLSEKFNEPLVRHILIHIYQMMVNGGDSTMLFEFNYLFDRLYELNSDRLIHRLKRQYENLAQMPMIGSGMLVMLIMVGIIGLLGSFLYV